MHAHPGQLVRGKQYPLLHKPCRLLHGKAAHICLPACVCARAKGGNVGILGGDYMHLFKRYAQLVRRHLAEGRVRALTYLGLRKLKLNGAVLIKHHTAGGAFKRYGPNGGIVPENGHAYAAPYGPLVVCELLKLPFVVYILHALFYALVKAIKIVLVFGETVLVANLHKVELPKLERGHVQPFCYIVHMAFHCEHHLGYAVAAHCARCRGVGEYCISVPLAGGTVAVQLPVCARALSAYAVAVAGVCALIGECFHPSRNEGTVRPHMGGYMIAYGVAHPVAGEGFLPGHVYLDKPAADHG